MADSPRRAIFDTLKGIGIVEVITHHCLGYSNRKFADEYSASWWTMFGINRVLHFAIPLFLLVSAALLTQSLVKRPDWGRFAFRRATRSLWPYLLWSTFYLVFRVAFVRAETDTQIVSHTYPLIGTLTGPSLFTDLRELFRELLWGKAYYHLYFLVVLIQLAIALPFVILLLRKVNLNFGRAAILAGASQIAVYLIQGRFVISQTPASMVLWYMPSLMMGVWIGLNMEEFRAVFARSSRYFWGVAALGLAAYFPISIAAGAGENVNSLAYNSTFSLYTISISLALFGIAPKIADLTVGKWLATFGRVSLPMFLVHPAILVLLGGPRITKLVTWLPMPALWITAIVFGVSYLIARCAMLLWLDVPLFGQRLPKSSQPQTVAA